MQLSETDFRTQVARFLAAAPGPQQTTVEAPQSTNHAEYLRQVAHPGVDDRHFTIQWGECDEPAAPERHR